MISCCSFMYTDTVDHIHLDNVVATMSCADKYDLPQLTQICSDFIESHLKVENCLSIWKQAVDWHVDIIMELCVTLMDAHTAAVLQSDGFTDISRETLQAILTRCLRKNIRFTRLSNGGQRRPVVAAPWMLPPLIGVRYWETRYFVYVSRF
ncbi:BTB/POZ domain-containing protein 1-like [Paramacrobiotus metropolitanus]|uniref:BTB/POZ domain-containing protein 1-like n=1 Tax=Paramacrobiotus metropolitanus TaxID=2943436 RepID=UPI0024459EBC|nr:BTB/POZ domain-containing protein 1-like [Paramacrobiotus metropolitanus]